MTDKDYLTAAAKAAAEQLAEDATLPCMFRLTRTLPISWARFEKTPYTWRMSLKTAFSL